MTTGAVLAGVGAWLPPAVVTNTDLCSRLDTTQEWIESRTGIRERRTVSNGVATVDLAVEAGVRALKSAGMFAVDAVVLATTSPDRTCPAGAPEVASRLGLGNVAAFDLTSACSGFVYGLATCAGLIATGVAESVLFIGAEAFSTFVNPADRTTAPIFGDGAGAVVLRRGDGDEPGAIGPFDLGSDGRHADLLAVFGGGSRQRAANGLGHADVPAEDWYLSMSGRAVYQHAVARMTASARTVLDRAGWSATDVDRFAGHQANLRIITSVAQQLCIPHDRVLANIDRTGNALAASIPILLAETAASGELSAGQRVLVTAFGAGLSWGSTVLEWPDITADSLI
ncbi:3-oxoacyl-[acyl-carrier-protein] synthase-3 [Saccharopolyspora erythraea NRRL 2338]|uniref:Beta-ketoacyl-[acyl-carrier-protein] synthase III n=1 Tax=Saccharopolyspora erythraea TaxID=1836 RepID=A0ABN1DVS2_SACER|nr:beta-ketoacyl-ACP synthase III [Saccharopolyspora erythraea]EQD84134.1 3-oxoacyl-ACP synthase [Saccharopolyspora erythraea D]PFG98365.1 3-oxoacyl-[acyl-carrier-protein] synthase-3 [Saccharopolyspora erythraea NRRL 2338]QRK88437.1 ketoacyl-ACP synthase III [Saccharopolyspora erythraea]